MAKKMWDRTTIDESIARNKAELLSALQQNSGIVASSCRACGLTRQTFYNYYNDDPKFKEAVDDVKELQKDFAESLILKKMKEGDTTMIIFYAKTQMKDRGYSERVEVTGKDGADLIQSKKIDLDKLTDEQRKVLLGIGQDILNKKE